MLSGIGPADHLKSHGIARRRRSAWRRAELAGSPEAVDPLDTARPTLPASTVTAGMFSRSAQESVGKAPRPAVLRRPRDSTTPDRFVTITVSLVRPKSRGEIRLRSADPHGAADHSRQLSAGARPTSTRSCAASGWRAASAKPSRTTRCARTRSLPGPGAKSDADLAALRAARGRHDLSRRRHLQDGAGRAIGSPWSTPNSACAASTGCASPTRRSCRKWSTRRHTLRA